MNKKEITVIRIDNDLTTEIKDFVAVEQELTFEKSTGEKVIITCSPGHEEELILGYRYASGDLEHRCSEGGQLAQVSKKMLLEFAHRILSMPEELFDTTGCAHSCALMHDGSVLCHMEDIKRHNALDKAIGYAIKQEVPLCDVIVFTSGRVSFDYLKKAYDAGIGVVASRAAVTDAAIDFAKENNITLLGFVRNGRANLYHEGRVRLSEE